MTYNEWRDELKNNLLTVSDAERKHVLDYYAEAYADRREAGFNERDIIEGFGAPYDAAQRILSESSDEYYHEPELSDVHKENADRRNYTSYDDTSREERQGYGEQATTHEQRRKMHQERATGNGRWSFVLLCVVLAIPTFAAIMSMIGITIGLCVAPISVAVSGIGVVITGIGTMFRDILSGVLTLGGGIFTLGVGIMLFPLCIWLAKLMWKLFKMFFGWLKQLCSGKEKA